MTADREWLVLGIDPGLEGAAALLRVAAAAAADTMALHAGVMDAAVALAAAGRARRPDLLVTPPTLERLVGADDLAALAEMAARADLVVVEAQSASPQMGVASAFRLGEATGRVHGVLAAAGARKVSVVTPGVWRGAYGLSGGKDGKAAGLALADALLGGHSALKRHDEADAVLLAWWGYRHLLLTGSC